MPQSSFPCPYCSAPLRTRNRKLIGTQVTCPDCGKPLQIISDGPRELAARKADAPRSRRSATEKKQQRSKTTGRLRQSWNVLKSPVGIAWTVAGCLAIMLFIAAWPFGNSSSPKRLPTQTADELPPDKEKDKPAVDPSKIAEHKREKDIAVDRNPVFPEPVVALNPAPAVDADKPPTAEPAPHRPPVIAEIPPDLIDIAAALAQPILRFDQQKPAFLRDLLMLVEEMAGVSLRYKMSDRHDEAKLLDTPITLQLQNTTVGEILKAILEHVDLDYQIGFNEILVVPKETK